MVKDNISFIVYIIAVFVSAISQILLKISANKHYENIVKEYVNRYVISAYSLLFGTTLLTIWALKNLTISMGSVLETLGYLFVALLSKIFLKEKISRTSFFGYTCIIVGIVIFVLLK